jgi:type I restriction enzyme S subunit
MWKTLRIADFGSVITGKTPSSNNLEHFGDDYPFITPTDMGTGRIVHTDRGISQEGYLKLRRQILPRWSVCFVCIGATIGKICLTTKKSLTNQQINSVVVDTTRHNPFFVYYLLSTYAEAVKSIAGGAATPIVNKTSFENIEVVVPPLPTQHKIASILSAYDDLIENNLRRIKILEEMAQNLYREWFVKFRFPGYQHTRFTDSPMGQIPEGWEVKLLGNLADQIRDGVNPDSVDPETPYFGLEHLPRESITLADWGFASEVHSTKLLFKKGDILFGKIRPYFHKVGVAPLPGVCSSDTIVIRPRSTDCFGLILGCTSSAGFVEHATATSQGTKMPRANWEVLEKYQVPMPCQSILGQFNEFMSDIVNQLHNVVFRNQTLRRTRDLLLPSLISGEVDVSELDIVVPEEATA